MSSKLKTYMVIDGQRDALGRAPFTLYWTNPDGVLDPNPQQVQRHRGQCFRAVPEDYIAKGAVLVATEAEAKAKAWR